MREKRTFAERTQVFASDKTLRKYFLVYEGSETEAIYFDAVSSLREKIEINPLIEIIPIIRSYSEDGWSNPKKILDRVIENLEESRTNHISYETLLNRIMLLLSQNIKIERCILILGINIEPDDLADLRKSINRLDVYCAASSG